ncbi:hypothetical protein Javan273_0006 [Streptococcus phage Javan273]|nr:hypothetical protein BKX95_00230 [Streptococcus iniae]QBX16748.1 hypothetical protein Javan273_0006 [Streptococcus phage Javan273]
MGNEEIVKTLLTVFGSSLVTLAGAMWKFKGQKLEVHSNTEKIYVENMEKIINTYQNDISGMKQDIVSMKRDIVVLKDEIEEKDKIIDDLRNKLRDAIAENKYLKEKLNARN